MTTIALMANTLHYPQGGGHRWAFLNWALGFRSIGCNVVWVEWVDARSQGDVSANMSALRAHLRPYGLADQIALAGLQDPRGAAPLLDLEDVAARADLLVNFTYRLPEDIVRRFRRSALIDIDPGLLQIWMATGTVQVARHDYDFTIGETVGTRSARFPDAGRRWLYSPPCVALESWPASPCAPEAPFTTVTHWWSEERMEEEGEWYPNDKRSGFLPFLDLPARVRQRLELAVFWHRPDEVRELEEHGWTVRHSFTAAATPQAYQTFIRASRGEFSCAKPSYVRLATAWISDRTLCYLATGRPAVVQHTGPSRILPSAEGLFRFTDLDAAARYLREADERHDRHARAARELTEEHFNARKVTQALLERGL
jgi:hypothetical protein